MGLALALGVRPEWAAAIRAFLPREAEPPKVFQHGSSQPGLAARAIKVFIAQDQRALMSPCAFLCGPERARVA
jgi:hypothetical protein